MLEKEAVIKDMAFTIHADMKFGINPASHKASINWLKLALAWAVRHKRKELEKTIREFMNDKVETESNSIVALAVNTI